MYNVMRPRDLGFNRWSGERTF